MQHLIPYLVSEGARWVATQRDHHRPLGRVLSEKEWSSLAPYYSANILETVVVREIPLIENPDFYQALSASGQPIPLDFSQMAGITFVDTIVFARRKIQPGWEAWI